MAKILKFNEEARRGLEAGVNKLADGLQDPFQARFGVYFSRFWGPFGIHLGPIGDPCDHEALTSKN